MIVQMMPNATLVYVHDHERDLGQVLQHFGMLNEDGKVKDYVRMARQSFTNDNGVVMPAIRVAGKTVEFWVVDDSVEFELGTMEDLVKALNHFPMARYTFGRHSFVGKFSAMPNAYTMYDRNRLGITINDMAMKDLNAIYDLMCHLDLNNGKLFEPVIARFVYAARQMGRRRNMCVGYFDLGEYLRIMRDDAAVMFSRLGRTGSELYFNMGGNKHMKVQIVSSVDGVANVDISGMKQVLETRKVNGFKPFVVMGFKPLAVGEMKFPWAKVKFDRSDVFMTPMMSGPEAWESLKCGIDLLSPDPSVITFQ